MCLYNSRKACRPGPSRTTKFRKTCKLILQILILGRLWCGSGGLGWLARPGCECGQRRDKKTICILPRQEEYWPGRPSPAQQSQPASGVADQTYQSTDIAVLCYASGVILVKILCGCKASKLGSPGPARPEPLSSALHRLFAARPLWSLWRLYECRIGCKICKREF